MRQLLRIEHAIIRKFRFDRMSSNLFWVAALVLPLIVGLTLWFLGLHEQPHIEFIMIRDQALSGEAAEIYYRNESFYFRPLMRHLLINLKPVTKTTEIQEDDQIVIGHTIFQVRQLDGWTPHLRTIGYYAADRDLNKGVSVGRSIHPEESNGWEVNEIIVKDNTFEPVHFMISPVQEQLYRIRSVGKKGISIPSKEDTSAKKESSETPQWKHLTTEAMVPAGQQIKIVNSIFELVYVDAQEALALKIVRGVRPTYKLSRQSRNVIGGLRMIPKNYIPDYLVDEEFLEYVRQAIESDLFFLDDPAQRQGRKPQLYVKGFDTSGKLVPAVFDKLSAKEKYLLHKIFRFWEKQGVALRWKRPFNREAKDSYTFYPDQIENFIINKDTNQVKNIHLYAARLTNPHTIAAEIATERGEIYDRDQFSHAKLWAYLAPNENPVTELLLIPSENPDTILAFNTDKEPDNLLYAAGGYRFSDGISIVNKSGIVQLISGERTATLKNGHTFTRGQYTFRYAAPGKGLLAQNLKKGNVTRRYYPLGNRLAHLIGYSFARSQFKGNIEKVFDKVLLGTENKKPWWSLERTGERTPGNDLLLTLDDDLQRVVYAELNKKLSALNEKYSTNAYKGGAIMLNTAGEILASASMPSYDPNDLRSILKALKESSEDHWNSSYINRATQKSYPPGSTMKVIMSTIALDNKAQFLWDVGDGQYKVQDGPGTFVCTGWLNSFQGISFGKYGIPDFGRSSHGQLTLDEALTKSCNNTFAYIALSAGWETIQNYAQSYGFNRQFDFLPYDMFKDDIQLVSNIKRDLLDPLVSLQSQVPTPKDRLKLSQLARMGIGQWEILATPLQMATVAMTVGNQGLRPYPHLVQGIQDRANQEIRFFSYPEPKRVFSADTLIELFPMMQHVVQQGSAIRITRSTIPYYSLKDHVAGKTGTAEVEQIVNGLRRKYNVVWFISFAPVENPKLALAVMIEKGPIISGEAVEIARGIWEKAVLLYPELFKIEKVEEVIE